MNLTLIYFVQDQQVLLAMKKRGFGAGKWNGIGGKIHGNESIEQAMIREAQEEVGVIPLKYQKVAEITFDQLVYGKKELNKVFVYISDTWRGYPTESEEMAPKWFKFSEVPYNKMWDADKIWLPKILAGEKLIGKISFDANDKTKSSDLHEIPTTV